VELQALNNTPSSAANITERRQDKMDFWGDFIEAYLSRSGGKLVVCPRTVYRFSIVAMRSILQSVPAAIDLSIFSLECND
jgi:hypothetical protein